MKRLCALAIASLPAAAWAQPAAEADDADGDALSEEDLALYKKLNAEPGSYARLIATTGFGRGFRFNNPYRLATQLGDTAESVSLTATYWDVGLAAAFGPPDGLQHGAAVHVSVSLHGVPQQALSGSYLLLYRADQPWMAYGRAGLSLLTQPDPNVGGELAGGFAYFFTGALGAHAELVGNLFYGAGTYEVAFSVIPVLSLQAGIVFDFEVLP